MHISPARVFVVAAALALLCDVMEYVPEGGREGFALAVRGALEPRSGRLAIITNRELAEGIAIDVQDAGFVQRPCAQVHHP